MATRIAFRLRTHASTVRSHNTYQLSITNILLELDLPEYDSYDHLRAQLLKAITQGSEYFGFA